MEIRAAAAKIRFEKLPLISRYFERGNIGADLPSMAPPAILE